MLAYTIHNFKIVMMRPYKEKRKNETKTKIFKIILLIVVIAIMAITTVYLIPTFKELSNEAGQQAFKQK